MIIILMLSINSFSQNFNNYTITDSINKSKDQLYNETKIFIHNTWKSGKDVIQLDDKENGYILVKGVVGVPFSYNVYSTDVYYTYTIKFNVKNNKFRIILEDVNYKYASYPFNSASWTYYFTKLLNSKYESLFKSGMSENKYDKFKSDLIYSLNLIGKSYINQIKQNNIEF